MNTLAILLAPLVVLIPAAVPLPAVPEEAERTPVQRQVSIEQRVIIRIAPSIPDPRQRAAARISVPEPPTERYKEEKVKGCVPIGAIAAISPGEDNRLLLLLRDREILSASLEKSCNATEFYSGAYVERNADGKLCPKRELLQSRTGSKCQIARINRLVPRD